MRLDGEPVDDLEVVVGEAGLLAPAHRGPGHELEQEGEHPQVLVHEGGDERRQLGGQPGVTLYVV